MKSGKRIGRADGDLIVFLDCDLKTKAERLNTYFDALQHYDLVMASKRHPKSKVEAAVMRRFLGSVTLRWIFGSPDEFNKLKNR